MTFIIYVVRIDKILLPWVLFSFLLLLCKISIQNLDTQNQILRLFSFNASTYIVWLLQSKLHSNQQAMHRKPDKNLDFRKLWNPNNSTTDQNTVNDRNLNVPNPNNSKIWTWTSLVSEWFGFWSFGTGQDWLKWLDFERSVWSHMSKIQTKKV